VIVELCEQKQLVRREGCNAFILSHMFQTVLDKNLSKAFYIDDKSKKFIQKNRFVWNA
jgi:hypothetical protein